MGSLTAEGTDTVKQSKLQRLTKEFETIVMEEDETFDQFYAKLNDIVNSVFNLGDEIPENKIVKKILSLYLRGYGHYVNECANKKNGTKKKALNTTWDKESSEEEKEPLVDIFETVNGKFVAFMVKSLSDNDIDEDYDDEMLDQEKDYEELYHTTYADCVRMTKYGNKITIKFKAAQEENSARKIELE
ncbi:hypothetical protein MRB53_011093 [Persea americana]|uniref:Uncharacterized protein n=1 Tax=Persea americana TaxID=3435 RepID=A0ACC2LTX2_PERAE|nr:hypothetical protein MRB53_011093 [Persea americana]